MWGTDYNRTKTLHSYSEAVRYLDEIDTLSSAAKAQLYGGTLSRIFRWSPAASVRSRSA